MSINSHIIRIIIAVNKNMKMWSISGVWGFAALQWFVLAGCIVQVDGRVPMIARQTKEYIPWTDTTRCINVCLTLVQRHRRWTSVKTTLIQRLVSAGIGLSAAALYFLVIRSTLCCIIVNDNSSSDRDTCIICQRAAPVRQLKELN